MNAEVKTKAELAEICGIHAGDGWMASTTNEVGYGTSPKEESYFQEVLTLYKRHFDMKFLRILKRLAIEFRFQSKETQNELMELGFVRGKKLDRLAAPKFVFKKSAYMRSFLRGLVDTDGNVYWRPNKKNYYLVIYWMTTSKKLADDAKKLLSCLGYTPKKYSMIFSSKGVVAKRRSYRVYLVRKDDIKKYLIEIGFRNAHRWHQVKKKPKELVKYDLVVKRNGPEEIRTPGLLPVKETYASRSKR